MLFRSTHTGLTPVGAITAAVGLTTFNYVTYIPRFILPGSIPNYYQYTAITVTPTFDIDGLLIAPLLDGVGVTVTALMTIDELKINKE